MPERVGSRYRPQNMKTPNHPVNLSRAAGAAVALSLIFAFAAPAQAQHSSGSSSSSSSSMSSKDTGTSELSKQGRKFIEKAAKSGLKEVRLSRLAAERTSDPDVRDLANTIMHDHQDANAQLASIANSKGVMVPITTASASMQMNEESTSPSTSTSAGTSTATGGASTGAATTQPGTDYETTRTARNTTQSEAEEDVQEAVNKLSKKTGAEFDRSYVDMMVKDHKDAVDLFEKEAGRTDDPQVSSFAQQTLPKLREHLEKAQTLQKQFKS